MPLSKGTIRWGYFIAFVLLLTSYFLVFFTIYKQKSETRQVTHSHLVITNLETLKAEIIDAETGVRGFFLTKDERFLSPYINGAKNVIPLFGQLKNLTSDNKSYKEELDTLQRLIIRRMDHLDKVITVFRNNGMVVSESLLATRESARLNVDSIRSLISKIKSEEQVLRSERNERLQNFFAGTEIISISSLVVVLVTIFYSLFIYNRGSKEKEASDNKAKRYSLELEERVKELKQVNEELEVLKSVEKFTSTGRIARTIAHEVRNPLTNISLASEQLKDFASNNPESELLLDMISRNVVRINQLVSDLLNSTRFAQLEYASGDINQLLDETLELANDRIELNKIKVTKSYGNSIGKILMDREKMKLAFLNIIVNAIEAMPQDRGVLNISTRKVADRCVIEISDNGMGMDDDTLQKLFEPYFTGKPKGNGLGLTNTQNIILNHKGSINVRSEQGMGSTFIVTLSTRTEKMD
ncbi:MAG: CHASE3 domain-containing protein [Chitinophagaceae bacterium]